MGPAVPEDVVRARCGRRSRIRSRTSGCRRSISLAPRAPPASLRCRTDRDRSRRSPTTPRAWHAPAHAHRVRSPRQSAAEAHEGAAAIRPASDLAGAHVCGASRRRAVGARRARHARPRQAGQRPRGRARRAHRIEAAGGRRRWPSKTCRIRTISWCSRRPARSTDPGAAARATPPLLTALGAHHRGAQGHLARSAHGDPQSPAGVRRQRHADELEGYLTDFDPRVAEKAAEILSAWTRKPRTPAPHPLPAPGVTAAVVDSLRGRSLRFVMSGGAVIRHRVERGCGAVVGRAHRPASRRGLLQRAHVPSRRAQLRHSRRQPRRQRVRGRSALHARRGGPAPPRHGRHLHPRPRHRRRADLREPRRLTAGSTTSIPSSARLSPAWTWWTAFSKATSSTMSSSSDAE